VARVRVDEPPPAPRGPSTARLAVDGLKLILSRPLLRASLACTATVNLFTFIANALLILFASRELGLTPGQIGLSLGVGAVGAVLGAVLAPPVSRLWGIGPAAIVGAALFPLPIAVTALAGGATWQKMALLGGMEFLSGIGVMLLDVNLNALLTRATPDDARGRRAGAYSAVNYGVRPLGALSGGFIGTAIGVRPSLVIAGVGGALCAFWLLASPVRHLHTIDDVDCE
jgi:MFS family permease